MPVEDPRLEIATEAQVEMLDRINEKGWNAAKNILASGRGIAFLGAGASAPLYPLWGELIDALISAASFDLSPEEIITLRLRAASEPDAVVDAVRQALGINAFDDELRKQFRVRRLESGKSWTEVHELVAQSDFRGIVTTNYDPGILDARMHVRPGAVSTGFATWQDDEKLQRWATDDIFQDDELPVLFAHGEHTRPRGIVLSSAGYLSAYSGRLGRVLAGVLERGTIIWIGFGFFDRRVRSLIDQVTQSAGTVESPGRAPRHVAFLPWDVDGGESPRMLRKLAASNFDSDVVLYPVKDGSHSALHGMLAALAGVRAADTRSDTPRRGPADGDPELLGEGTPSGSGAQRATRARDSRASAPPAEWVHAPDPSKNYTGREIELKRLSRWAKDPEVRVVAITGWGGAGKTSLVTHWVESNDAVALRPGLQGFFGWNLYSNRSGEAWATALLKWMSESFTLPRLSGPLVLQVVEALQHAPVMLVIDGFEVVQEGKDSAQFGRILDGTLAQVLNRLCYEESPVLAVVMSRFPLLDFASASGNSARTTDVPPLSIDEGADLLSRSGGGWLSPDVRAKLVAGVDGHPLALTALAGALESRPPVRDIRELEVDLRRAGRTDRRVRRVLEFYARTLSDTDLDIVAVTALFQSPVSCKTIARICTNLGQRTKSAPIEEHHVEDAANSRLMGLLNWRAGGTLTVHPLVADEFRPRVLNAESASIAGALALDGVPVGPVTKTESALLVAEVIELLADARDMSAADEIYRGRTMNGHAIWRLPAVESGMRCAAAFVADDASRQATLGTLGNARLVFYANEYILFALAAGKPDAARRLIDVVTADFVDSDSARAVIMCHESRLHGQLGDPAQAARAGLEALATARRSGALPLRPSVLAVAASALAAYGEPLWAEWNFVQANALQRADSVERGPLRSAAGIAWAEFLIATGRMRSARELTDKNLRTSAHHHRIGDVARCEYVLARCDIADGDFELAVARLERAAGVLRMGGCLLEWSRVMITMADAFAGLGNLTKAMAQSKEPLEFAEGGGLVPLRVEALLARARVCVEVFRVNSDPDALERAAADARLAYRLAGGRSDGGGPLPWAQMEAARASIAIAGLGDGSSGPPNEISAWTASASRLKSQLLGWDMVPNPLEAQAAEQPGVLEDIIDIDALVRKLGTSRDAIGFQER